MWCWREFNDLALQLQQLVVVIVLWCSVSGWNAAASASASAATLVVAAVAGSEVAPVQVAFSFTFLPFAVSGALLILIVLVAATRRAVTCVGARILVGTPASVTISVALLIWSLRSTPRSRAIAAWSGTPWSRAVTVRCSTSGRLLLLWWLGIAWGRFRLFIVVRSARATIVSTTTTPTKAIFFVYVRLARLGVVRVPSAVVLARVARHVAAGSDATLNLTVLFASPVSTRDLHRLLIS